MTDHLMKTYQRQPIAFTHGQGCRIWDTQGRVYLDGLAGIAVSGLGHGHPRLVNAIHEQAQQLIHTSNLYEVPLQSALANRLCELSGLQEAFFCNSGTEANEAAIKLARLYGHKQGIDVPKIVVMQHAFHGRTLGALAATGNLKTQIGFGPLPEGFIRVPYNDLAALQHAVANEQGVVAVMLEVLQGEGGISIASAEYLQQLRQLCDHNNWLLMVDEVQCGVGRTGTWFGFQHANILPDVMTLAKGLGSGVPVGACLTSGKAVGVFGPGNHGTTFGGNPLACRAALTTLEVIEDEHLLKQATEIGAFIRAELKAALADVEYLTDIRGKGLMIGIELAYPCASLVASCRDAGLLINVTRDNVVRLLPPLIMSEDEARELVSILAQQIRAFKPEA